MNLTVQALACRRSGRLVFSGLSFALSAGEALAVTGRNGAGKSTLLALLAGRLRPDSGTIAAEGLGEATLPERLHWVGHRDALKSALTAEENLAFARDLLGDPALSPRDALDAVGLAHAAPLPVAYLSAGQRRRVALARLLVAHRPLWLLDEPTSALDAASQATLLRLMQEHLAGGGLIVAATHQDLGIAGAKTVRIERTPSPRSATPSPRLRGEGWGEGPVGETSGDQGTSPLPCGEGPGVGVGPEGTSELDPAPTPTRPADAVHPRRKGEGREPHASRSTDRPLTPALSPQAGRGSGAAGRGGEAAGAAGTARAFLALVARDLQLAARIGGSGVLGLVFFLMIVTLIPFALGPDLNLLARIGPAVLWLAAVLSTLIGLDRLFQGDEEDGSLDLLRAAPSPLELSVLAKVTAHWLTTGLPLALAAPLFGLLVALTPEAMGAMVATLLVGTPALTFIGAIGAALTASLRRGGLILAILVLPLMIPTLIFGVSSAQAVTGGTVPFLTPFLILAALSLMAAVVGTVAAAAALRWGE